MEDARSSDIQAAKQVMDTAFDAGIFPSPANIRTSIAQRYNRLGDLNWRHYDLVPKKMRITNSGHTVLVSAKWNQERPYLSGGPLFGRYVFSQLHFHWGRTDSEGSEHAIDGKRFPLEMHIVFFKSHYLTQEAALKELDGMVVVVYLFEIQHEDNPNLQQLIESLPKIHQCCKSFRIKPIALSSLAPPFPSDYLLYWGSMSTESCSHAVLWMFYHTFLPVSLKQMSKFRWLKGFSGNLILENWREAQPFGTRILFHIIPSKDKNRDSGGDRHIQKNGQRGSNNVKIHKKYNRNKMEADNHSSSLQKHLEEQNQSSKLLQINPLNSYEQNSNLNDFPLPNKATSMIDVQNKKKQVLVLQNVHAFYHHNSDGKRPKIKLIVPKIVQSAEKLIQISNVSKKVNDISLTDNNRKNRASSTHEFHKTCSYTKKYTPKNYTNEDSYLICPSCTARIQVSPIKKIHLSKMKTSKFENSHNNYYSPQHLSKSSSSVSVGDLVSIPTAICLDKKSLNPVVSTANSENSTDADSSDFAKNNSANYLTFPNSSQGSESISTWSSINQDELINKINYDFMTNVKTQISTNIVKNLNNDKGSRTHNQLSGSYLKNILTEDKETPHIAQTIPDEKVMKIFDNISWPTANNVSFKNVMYHLLKISDFKNEDPKTDYKPLMKFLVYCAYRYYSFEEASKVFDSSSANNNIEGDGDTKQETTGINYCKHLSDIKMINAVRDDMINDTKILKQKSWLKQYLGHLRDNANSVPINEEEFELESNILGKLLMYYYVSNSDYGKYMSHMSSIPSSFSSSTNQFESEEESCTYLSPHDNQYTSASNTIMTNSIGTQCIINVKCRTIATQYSNLTLGKCPNGPSSLNSRQFSAKNHNSEKKWDSNIIDIGKFEQIRKIKNSVEKHRVFRHFSTNNLVLGRNTDQTKKLFKHLTHKVAGNEKSNNNKSLEASRKLIEKLNNKELHHLDGDGFRNKGIQRNFTRNLHSHMKNDFREGLIKETRHIAQVNNFENRKKRIAVINETLKQMHYRGQVRGMIGCDDLKANIIQVSPIITVAHIEKQLGSRQDKKKAPINQYMTDKGRHTNYSLLQRIKSILSWFPKEI